MGTRGESNWKAKMPNPNPNPNNSVPEGHASATRYGFLRDLESSEPFLICSHFL